MYCHVATPRAATPTPQSIHGSGDRRPFGSQLSPEEAVSGGGDEEEEEELSGVGLSATALASDFVSIFVSTAGVALAACAAGAPAAARPRWWSETEMGRLRWPCTIMIFCVAKTPLSLMNENSCTPPSTRTPRPSSRDVQSSPS